MPRLTATLSILLLSLSLSSLLSAQAPQVAPPAQVTGIAIRDFGVYTLDPQQVTQTSVNGLEQRNVENVRLAAQTRIVRMQKGVHFGFHYALVGAPPDAHSVDALVTLRMVTIFPPGGLHKPGTSQPIQQSEFTVTQPIGEKHNFYHGIALDYDWALVPGNWTLEIWQGDRRLTSQVFTLVR